MTKGSSASVAAFTHSRKPSGPELAALPRAGIAFSRPNSTRGMFRRTVAMSPAGTRIRQARGGGRRGRAVTKAKSPTGTGTRRRKRASSHRVFRPAHRANRRRKLRSILPGARASGDALPPVAEEGAFGE